MFRTLFSIITAPYRVAQFIVTSIWHGAVSIVKAPFKFVGYVVGTPKRIFNRLFKKNNDGYLNHIDWQEHLDPFFYEDKSFIKRTIDCITDIPKNILDLISQFNIFRNRNI